MFLIEKRRGLSPEGFTAMIAESGLRYRGALRLTVDDTRYALKVLVRDLPRGPFNGLAVGEPYRKIAICITKACAVQIR